MRAGSVISYRSASRSRTTSYPAAIIAGVISGSSASGAPSGDFSPAAGTLAIAFVVSRTDLGYKHSNVGLSRNLSARRDGNLADDLAAARCHQTVDHVD